MKLFNCLYNQNLSSFINGNCFLKNVILAFLVINGLTLTYSNAQSTQNNSLVRATVGVAGSSDQISNQTKNFTIQQSIGQPSVIGTFFYSKYTLRQGFIQPDVMAKLIDNSIPLGLDVMAYPNPFTDYVSVAFNETIETDIQITLYDFLGRQLATRKYASSQSVKIDFTHLSIAYYLIKINANNKQFITKILKK